MAEPTKTKKTPEEIFAFYQALASPEQKQVFEDALIILLGAQSSGKTTLACSASDFAPLKYPAEKLTFLEDLSVIKIDDGALDCLIPLRLRVPPKNVIDFPAIVAQVKHPVEAWNIAIDLARSHGTTKLLADSVSQWDALLSAYLNSDGQALWGGDKFAYYRVVKAQHQIIMAKFKQFKGLRMATFHPRAVLDDLNANGSQGTETEGTKRKDRANALPGNAGLILGVDGSARDHWPKDASLVLACAQDKDKKRVVFTQYDSVFDIAAKSRFEGILPARLENAHLGEVIRTIRNFS